MKPALVSSVLVVALAACGAPPPPAHPLPTPTATPVPPPTAAPAPTPAPAPPLEAPAIVQVENSPEGRPQSGLGQADIVYEYVAEGGVGRFSVLFFTLPPSGQQVGPVRSARTVTVQLGSIYQGFLAYSGSDAYIGDLLQAAAFASFDEDTAAGNLFRISSRDAPHNLYTDGAHLAALATMAARSPVSYQLWPRSTTTPAGGTPVTGFTADISFAEEPHFTWSASLGGFTRTEDTGPVDDPATGAPLVLPTVIVQQVDVTTDPNVVDVLGHDGVDQRITGTGAAQVFTGGQEFSATWSQPAHGPPAYTLAGGAPAPIAPGEVWICLVPTGSPAVLG